METGTEHGEKNWDQGSELSVDVVLSTFGLDDFGQEISTVAESAGLILQCFINYQVGYKYDIFNGKKI